MKFMHISSGCVYTGAEKEFTEEDPPNFCFNSEIEGSFYSGTKALSEELINKDSSFICRLRIPFDHVDGPRNYLSKIQNYQKLLDAKMTIGAVKFLDSQKVSITKKTAETLQLKINQPIRSIACD